MTTIRNIAGLYIPAERRLTEHGDYRTSYWGVGYATEAIARYAARCAAGNQPVPEGVLLDDAMVQRLAEMGRSER